MPLEILAIMVVAGLSLVIAAVHFSGLSHVARFDGDDQAINRFNEDYPDEKVCSVFIAAGNKTAFLELADGRTGLVQAVGDRFLTRVINRAAVAEAKADRNGWFYLRLNDFSLPRLRAEFAAPHHAEMLRRGIMGQTNG